MDRPSKKRQNPTKASINRGSEKISGPADQNCVFGNQIPKKVIWQNDVISLLLFLRICIFWISPVFIAVLITFCRNSEYKRCSKEYKRSSKSILVYFWTVSIQKCCFNPANCINQNFLSHKLKTTTHFSISIRVCALEVASSC